MKLLQLLCSLFMFFISVITDWCTIHGHHLCLFSLTHALHMLSIITYALYPSTAFLCINTTLGHCCQWSSAWPTQFTLELALTWLLGLASIPVFDLQIPRWLLGLRFINVWFLLLLHETETVGKADNIEARMVEESYWSRISSHCRTGQAWMWGPPFVIMQLCGMKDIENLLDNHLVLPLCLFTSASDYRIIISTYVWLCLKIPGFVWNNSIIYIPTVPLQWNIFVNHIILSIFTEVSISSGESSIPSHSRSKYIGILSLSLWLV